MATNKSPKHRISYQVSARTPHQHYFDVELSVKLPEKSLILHLPVWTPGSYMVRDYASHLFGFQAFLKSGKKADWKQIDLSTWEVENKEKECFITYRVYAFENTVRTNFLDTEFGFINSPGLFMYPEKYKDHKVSVHFELNNYFKNIYSPLLPKDGIYTAKDFDELYDSPFLLTDKDSKRFKVQDCEHEIIIQGEISKQNEDRIYEDLKIITEYQLNAMKSCPNDYYLFIINLTENGYGGLEHKSSSVNIFDGSSLDNFTEYKRLLGLLSHEYFHLWNVKRIRPIALGPFDYQKPVLTKELWIAEGLTSFFDNYFLFKTGQFSRRDYLQEIVNDISRIQFSEGERHMSLEESSFTAWTKYYKQNQNSHNISISYYIKGALLSLCMNIAILEKSNGQKELIDVLHFLYKNYAIKKERGFSKKEFFEAILESTGFDLYEEFNPYIAERVHIPVENYLKKIGVLIVESTKKSCLHFEIKNQRNKDIVNKIYSHLIPDVDLSLGDEILAVNNHRIDKDNLEKIGSSIEDNTQIEVLLARRGIIKKVTYPAKYSYNLRFELEDEIIEKSPIARKFFESGSAPK